MIQKEAAEETRDRSGRSSERIRKNNQEFKNNTSAFFRKVKERGEERLGKLTEEDRVAVLVSHQLLLNGASPWRGYDER